MFKKPLKLSFIILLLNLTVACSGITNKELDYNEAKSMSGYGYITMDFSQTTEMEYGQGFIPDQTDYSISYTNQHYFLSVHVKNASFKGRVLKAYIPYMKGYTLYSVTRSYWYPYHQCEKCQNEPQLEFLSINIINSVNEAWCAETTYKNIQKYNSMNGCPQMIGVEEARKAKGNVFITPHFHSGFQGMFTPYLKPGHQSAGS
ncbi:hypothetical protein AHS81_23125 [Salmonella enterica]|nr:hypothetical protein [Salmonella enterica]EAM8770849.1 hypothetical protein [Salmonella enterica]EAP0381183.1 hypothetical protein [Salmonella enterica]EBQ7681084.1 hypothetical protein [Salmonella enterica]